MVAAAEIPAGSLEPMLRLGQVVAAAEGATLPPPPDVPVPEPTPAKPAAPAPPAKPKK